MSRVLRLYSVYMGHVTVLFDGDTTFVSSQRGENAQAPGVGFYPLRDALVDNGIPWVEAVGLTEDVFAELRA